MHRAAFGIVLALTTVFGLAGSAGAQQAPGAGVAAPDSSTPGVPRFPAPPEGDPRANFSAPAHVSIHAGAKAGDWLERVKTRHRPEGVSKERTTIAGRIGDLWIIDRTNPIWVGRSLRLVCAADGRVLTAAAAKPGEEELVAVKVQAEPEKLESTPVELDTAIGKVKALRQRVKVGAHADDVATRFVGAEGAFEGVSLGREFDHDGRKSAERIVGLEAAKIPFAGADRECFKLTLESSVNGTPKGRVDVWLSKKAIFFGEHAIQRKDALSEERLEQGVGGEPVFPLPR
jgi:hypothetical protein